jgi:hypothetical protein
MQTERAFTAIWAEGGGDRPDRRIRAARRCDTPLVNGSDQARLPVFGLLLVVQGLATIVFGVVPLLLPRTFASITGYSGDDEFVYRLAGAATTGYLVAAIAALVWRSSWLDVRIALIATLTFTTAAALACLVTVIGGDSHWVVIVVLLAAAAFAVIAAYWLRRDAGALIPAGDPISPVFKVIIGLATLSAGVFGVMPLVAPTQFASLFGLVGTDTWIFRMAGAACLGYATAGILEFRAAGLRRIAVQNLGAIAFNVAGAASAWLALLIVGHGGLLAPVIAAAATTFAVLLIWIQRSAQEGPR